MKRNLHSYTRAEKLLDSPIELVVGTLFLYHLLGVSSLVGLAMTFVFLPINHFAGKTMLGTQDDLMAARDERTALMNEVRSFDVDVVGISGLTYLLRF